MKQKDIFVIVLVVFISGLASYFLSKTFITSPKNRQQSVEVVEVISSDFVKPNTKYFNNQSIDPTQLIKIGEPGNTDPFKER